MRLIVSGDRNGFDRGQMWAVLDSYLTSAGGALTIVEGCARGVDRMAEEWAAEAGVPVEHHPADWERHGKAAGPIRNREMLRADVDALVAFHHDINSSKGTKDMVLAADAYGLPYRTVGSLLTFGQAA